MSIKSDCENLLSVLSELESLHVESDAAYALAVPLLEIAASSKEPEVIANAEKVKETRALAQERFRTISTPGNSEAQFAALEQIIDELADGSTKARGLLDGLYEKLNLGGLPDLQKVSLKMRETIGKVQGVQELTESLLKLNPPESVRNQMRTLLQPVTGGG